MPLLRKSLFFITLLCSLFPLQGVFAASTCVCTTTEKDCQTVFLPMENQSAAACTTTCKKIFADKFAVATFAEDTAAEVLYQQCTDAHKTFEAGKASASGTQPKAAKTESITPTLNVQIPGLKFSDALSGPCSFNKEETCIKTNFLGDYLNAVYAFLIGAATVIAIVMIMIGGLQYTIGATNTTQVEKGKDRIKNAVTGLVLLLCVFMVLKTTNPQLVFLKIIELQNVEEIEFEDAPVDAGSETPIDPSIKTGPPSTKGDGAIITRLIGALPSSMTKCSKEALNYAADALTKKNICVGPMHCAYAASNILEYVGCTKIYNGNASWLPAALDAEGWSAETIRSPKQFKSLPFGLLVMPGHVGISLGDGFQFDSGGSTLSFLKNAEGKQTCEANNITSRAGNGCGYCSLIPEEAPSTKRFTKDEKSENQGWFKIDAVKTAGGWRADPSRGTWQIILVPPSQASLIHPARKIPCLIHAGKSDARNVTISENLCKLIQLPRADWKALDPKP